MTLNYNSPNEIKAFLDERGLSARKMFGQNFLVNEYSRQNLLDTLRVEKGDTVWEVGPGLGAMTAGLLERGADVCAFEVDAGFCKILNEFFAGDPHFSLIEGDVLKTYKQFHIKNEKLPLFFSNLPYNIAQMLLTDFIEDNIFFRRMVVTVQKEVAFRFSAKPNSKDYSALSVLTSLCYDVKLLSVLKGSSFYPVPKIDSRSVFMEMKAEALSLPTGFSKLVHALFANRRKTIYNNLLNFLSSQQQAAEVLRAANIAANKRAEELEPESFLEIAKRIQENINHKDCMILVKKGVSYI